MRTVEQRLAFLEWCLNSRKIATGSSGLLLLVMGAGTMLM